MKMPRVFRKGAPTRRAGFNWTARLHGPQAAGSGQVRTLPLPEGQRLYARRESTIEAVFGILNGVPGVQPQTAHTVKVAAAAA